jgi:small-conductance mechanosensitive channel
VIVRAIRGEEAKENWKTFTSTGLLIGVWTLTSGARVREMAALRGAAVKMRGLAHDAAAESERRDQRSAERDRRASEHEARMLSLTKWLVALAGLTLAAAIVTLVVAVAQSAAAGAPFVPASTRSTRKPCSGALPLST